MKYRPDYSVGERRRQLAQAPSTGPATGTTPAAVPPQALVDAINSAVAAAQTAQSASANATAAAQEAQRLLIQFQQQQQQQPQPQPQPQQAPVAAVTAPAVIRAPAPEQQPGGATFAVPGFEAPLAGTEAAGGEPLAGLASPSAEISASLVEEGGLPAAAIPPGLPARLNASLQGQQPLVQGGGGSTLNGGRK